MFRFLLDTCVWLDIAKDPDLQPLLDVMERLVQMDALSFVVPQVVLDEFSGNKERVVAQSSRSLSATFKRVKEAVDKFGDPRKKRSVLRQLNDVDHRIPLLGESVADAVGKVERMMASALVIATTDAMKLKATQRAIEKKAPFHRGKNSMVDALILEAYAHCLHGPDVKGIRFAFVTHNKDDFSDPQGDKRKPHPDLAPMFSRVKSLYFISLKDALSRVNPGLLGDFKTEEYLADEPRKFSEIADAIDGLFDKVWYGRHGTLAEAVREGKIRVVDEAHYPTRYNPRMIRSDIWEGAKKAAKRVEKRYGRENLGPWSDFDWGMLSGKMSALRWVLGDEWDMLDT